MNTIAVVLVVLAGATAAAAAAAADAPKPHILMVLADDYGWANAGWHSRGDPEVVTPNMDALVSAGIELDRHYVHMMCTPSRTSFQSGRLPVHVQLNLGDPCSSATGMPRNMTAIPAHLKQAGYATHLVGKW
jgi:arylsulfatase B